MFNLSLSFLSSKHRCSSWLRSSLIPSRICWTCRRNRSLFLSELIALLSDSCESDGCESDSCESDGCESDSCESDGCESDGDNIKVNMIDEKVRVIIVRVVVTDVRYSKYNNLQVKFLMNRTQNTNLINTIITVSIIISYTSFSVYAF